MTLICDVPPRINPFLPEAKTSFPCPRCEGRTEVKNSRPCDQGIKRRRVCAACGHRLTTYERADKVAGADREALLARIVQAHGELAVLVDRLRSDIAPTTRKGGLA